MVSFAYVGHIEASVLNRSCYKPALVCFDMQTTGQDVCVLMFQKDHDWVIKFVISSSFNQSKINLISNLE